ncbi:hypothetical protein ACJRO7_014414 [Eucalyptus globulus]|uniref:RNase H type-1 domain-containing protein n=1 Tax=Eucalyptus globulus TaxID=34317 RepID=A0ABD3L607_EUCGL
MKINVDGSICAGSREGAISCIVRDFSGCLVDGFTETVRAASVAQLEALALLEALKYIKKKQVGVVSVGSRLSKVW